MIEDDDIIPIRLRLPRDFLGFTRTDEITRVHLTMVDQQAVANDQAERTDEFLQLFQETRRFVTLASLDVRPDEQRAHGRVYGSDNIRHSTTVQRINPRRAWATYRFHNAVALPR